MTLLARVRDLLPGAEDLAGELRDLAVQIASIPAPTGHETDRSSLLAELWESHGLDDVERDDVGNVTGVLRGAERHPCLVVVANMDTAYPPGSEVAPRVDGGLVRGTGVYDNGAGLVVLLGAATLLSGSDVTFPGDVIFAATVQEEWGGNLRGMRRLMERLAHRATAVLNVGHDLAGLHHEAFGMTTLRLELTGPGGHAYAHLGTPSAIHTLVSALARILRVPRPEQPRTSLNVGLVEGGTSSNAIAERASAVIELRSTDAEVLDDLEIAVRRTVDDLDLPDGVTLAWHDLDRRPYGRIPSSHPLVQLVAAAHHEVGVGVRTEPSAADFNVPLSLGVPAVITGAATGGGIKSAAEYLDPASLVTGVKSLTLGLGLLMDHHWDDRAASDADRTIL